MVVVVLVVVADSVYHFILRITVCLCMCNVTLSLCQEIIRVGESKVETKVYRCELEYTPCTIVYSKVWCAGLIYALQVYGCTMCTSCYASLPPTNRCSASTRSSCSCSTTTPTPQPITPSHHPSAHSSCITRCVWGGGGGPIQVVKDVHVYMYVYMYRYMYNVCMYVHSTLLCYCYIMVML